ncbi:chitotriosidase-1 [Nephila pilipes]|uniref:chitinase n=1 Tax=Nephila pilipes TaxID=299642 RepID=A0A8X6UM39_NEPPI|nr:chitotriosidase-1 [Nephila pilipes]
MKKAWLFSVLIIVGFPTIFASISAKSKKPYKIVCYLGSWANYRNGDGKFLIEDIDPKLCTHLIYGFAKLSHDNKIAAYDPYLDLKENWGLGAYERFTGLKKKNPNLKTLLAIGGWNEGSSKYSRMAKNPSSRKTFVDSCVTYLQRFGFDGLDLDWEYPATRGGIPEDKKNFILLLKELKEAFSSRGLLLTAAVSAGQKTIDVAYDIPALAKYLDFINLMAYDFHGGWDKVTGHNSPLYARPEEDELQKTLNTDYAVKYWLSKGAPAEKLILGLALYGRSFALKDALKNGLDVPVIGKGMAGEFTREQGFLGYHEICRKLQKEKGWTVTVEKHVQAPYIVKDKQWIGYDDIKSISGKVDYLIKMKLGGAMVWSLETDDFKARCHGRRYPLLQAINAVLNGTSVPLPDFNIDDDNFIFEDIPSSSASSPNTSPKTTPNTAVVTTENPGDDPLPCPQNGYFRHPKNCQLFYLCQPRKPGYNAGYQVYLFTCGAGTVFSEQMRTCAFPRNVPECSDD